MKTCLAILWFLTVTAAFVLGYSWGVSERYEAVEKVVLFDYNQQIKDAIREGIPFKLKGTDVNLLPRKDGQIRAAVARMEDEGKKIKQTSE